MRNPLDYNYRVRFHLQNGRYKNFWQVKREADGRTWYFDPTQVQLELEGCFLRNRKGTAGKIFLTGKKTTCAWVECKRYSIKPSEDKEPKGVIVHYNPEKVPYWLYNGQEADYKIFDRLLTWQEDVYTFKNTILLQE